MARIRTIKPEFFTSEDIVELEPLARLLYIALWCEADKEGRFCWKPKTFKMRYLPADVCDIDALCDALVTRQLVFLYGDGLAFIPSFKDHQHINPRETDSKLPSPDDIYSRVSDASSTRQDKFSDNPENTELHHSDDTKPRVSDASVTRREEGKGKESKNTRRERETPIPENFGISESVREWAKSHGYDQLDQHLANFIDSCKAKGYKYVDWDAAFRNAIAKNWARVVVTKPIIVGDPDELITCPDGRKITKAEQQFLARMMS